MKTAIANVKDIANPEENPTLCLSAKRYVGGCYHCAIFRSVYMRTKQNLKETLKKLACKPNITKETITSLVKLKSLYEKKKELDMQIAKIDEQLLGADQ